MIASVAQRRRPTALREGDAKVQAVEKGRQVPAPFPPSCKTTSLAVFAAALLLLALSWAALACPASAAPPQNVPGSPAINNSAPNPGDQPPPLPNVPNKPRQTGTNAGGDLTPQGWEVLVIALFAFFFAWLKVVKDFRHYKGLLHILLYSAYTWVFVAFIAAGSFVLDYLLLPYIRRYTLLKPSFISHSILVLGHASASGLVANVSPFLLRKVSRHPNALADEQPEKPKEEKHTSEMNSVFEAMRESLEGHVNATLSDWTKQYDWPVLKFAAKTLVMDRQSSGAISLHEKEERLQSVDRYAKCDDVWEDRQRKYELLRTMMGQSSFQDLRRRLAQASKTS